MVGGRYAYGGIHQTRGLGGAPIPRGEHSPSYSLEVGNFHLSQLSDSRLPLTNMRALRDWFA